jgi:hypothetical protein
MSIKSSRDQPNLFRHDCTGQLMPVLDGMKFNAEIYVTLL